MKNRRRSRGRILSSSAARAKLLCQIIAAHALQVRELTLERDAARAQRSAAKDALLQAMEAVIAAAEIMSRLHMDRVAAMLRRTVDSCHPAVVAAVDGEKKEREASESAAAAAAAKTLFWRPGHDRTE